MTSFTLPGAAFASAVAWVNRLIPARPTAPPLAGVVLEAASDDEGAGTLTLSVFDFDTAAVTRIDADVHEPGRVLVSGRLLAAVTKTINAKAEVTLTVDGPTAKVDIGKGQGWELPTLDIKLYPKLPAAIAPVATVDAEWFADALGRVLPAAGTEAALPMYSQVNLSAEANGQLVLGTTDRYRVAVAELDWQPAPDRADGGTDVPEAFIPVSLARHVHAAVTGLDGDDITINADPAGRLFGVTTASRTLLGRQYDEGAPWRRVALAPDAGVSVALVAMDELRGAVERASVMLGDGESLRLQLGPEGIDVRPAVGGRGRAEHHAEVVRYDGEERLAGFNSSYLRTALEAMGSQMVEIRLLKKDWMPVLFLPADAGGETVPGYRHIVAQQKQAVMENAA